MTRHRIITYGGVKEEKSEKETEKGQTEVGESIFSRANITED